MYFTYVYIHMYIVEVDCHVNTMDVHVVLCRMRTADNHKTSSECTFALQCEYEDFKEPYILATNVVLHTYMSILTVCTYNNYVHVQL